MEQLETQQPRQQLIPLARLQQVSNRRHWSFWCCRHLVCTALVLAGWQCGTAVAELAPDEIAIIAVQTSPESKALALYYAKARNIPQSHICLINVPPGRDLTRAAWELSVRPRIRQWVGHHKLQSKLRCFVTTWDVPLKIGKSESTKQRGAYLKSERELRINRVLEILRIVAEIESTAPVTAFKNEEQTVGQLQKLSTEIFDAAKQRINEHAKPEMKGHYTEQLVQYLSNLGGVASLSKTISTQTIDDTKRRVQRDNNVQLLIGQATGLREGQRALEMLPESVERDQQILAIVEKSTGILGSIAWIDQQMPLVNRNETYSSFDSELSLLYSPNYPLMRWVPNLLHHSHDNAYARWLQQTLMVARLEAPTYKLTQGLIDTAIEVEKTGLAGTMYIDARGLESPRTISNGSYADYDEALRTTANLLTKHSDRKVVLDNENELFQPGACPDAALYCGWYSLSKYIDAFKWKPGAVAYHIASGEAATLRNLKSEVWCKRMLEEGVCATIGPVYEPYLMAFPRPNEFFPLFMSGRYSLVEAYYRTKPYNSWVMILVGDPLYNPFRDRSDLHIKDLPKELQELIEPKDVKPLKLPLRSSATVMHGPTSEQNVAAK